MQISSQNLLIVLDSALGQGRGLPLSDIENLILRGTAQVLRGRIESLLPDGRANIRLAGGDTFIAKLPLPLPEGTRLLLQAKLQGESLELLRYVVPPTVKPETIPLKALPPQPPLATLLADTPPKEGMKLSFTVEGPRPPAVGATVIGRIEGQPQGNQQTLALASGAKLHIPVPPVFEPGTEVVLKILNHSQAELNVLRPPVIQQDTPQPQQQPAPQALPTQPQQPVPQSGTPQPASPTPQPVAQSNPPVFKDVPLPQAPVPLATPLPPQVPRQTPLLAQYTPQQPATPSQPAAPAALKLENGQVIHLNPQPTTPLPQQPQMVAVRFNSAGQAEFVPTPQPEGAPPSPPQGQPIPPRTGQPLVQNNPQAIPLRPAQPERLATGTVTHVGGKGRLTLSFDNGLKMNVQAERTLPLGTQVTVKLLPDGQAEMVNLTLPKAPQAERQMLGFSLRWPGLEQAIQVLRKENPAALDTLKQNLPRLNEGFLPGITHFAQALAGRTLDSLFDKDTLTLLRNLGLDGTLHQDLNTLSSLHQQRPDAPDSWRAMFFPYWDDDADQARQGSFFWRRGHEGDDEKGQTNGDSTRFVVNVSLSRLGSIQIDGLIRDNAMRLKLRTLEDLGPDFERDLQLVVKQALDAVGMSGEIRVESVNFFETDPMQDMLASSRGINVEI